MDIFVLRNNQRYGPYNEQSLLAYVNEGKILLQDKAVQMGEVEEQTVGYYLRKSGLKCHILHNGNLVSQIKTIGTELIFPKHSLISKSIWTDPRFIILAVVGLLPMIIMHIPLGGFMLFYVVSLYFSIVWYLFFYSCFKTSQVSLKTTLCVFFLTQFCVFLVWDVLGLPKLNPFYSLTNLPFPFNMGGYVLGVGLTEELGKMLPLLFILRKAKEPMIPQTMVFYGLMSGIAFGVYEGVQYQMTINTLHTYDVSFFLNIARLTSLPFLHACWCGIGGYFLSFAYLYPKYRKGLFVLALSIPSLIHGIYDTVSDVPIVPLFVVFMGLILLLVYLKQGLNYQSKLKQ